jgi:superfamily II DNA or RNA helicase
MASGVGVLTSGLHLASATSHTRASTTILGRGLRRASHADATTSVFSTSKENLSWRPNSARKRQSRASRHAFSSTAGREHTTCSYSFPSSARGTAYRTAPLQPQSQTGEYLTYVLRSETDLFEKSVEAEVRHHVFLGGENITLRY